MKEEEFKVFEQTLKEKLPVTFRINTGELNHHKFSEMLRAPQFIENYTNKDFEPEVDQRESVKTQKIDYDQLSMDCKPYYPGQVLFEMMIPREMLKKNLGLKQIH